MDLLLLLPLILETLPPRPATSPFSNALQHTQLSYLLLHIFLWCSWVPYVCFLPLLEPKCFGTCITLLNDLNTGLKITLLIIALPTVQFLV